ncbi:MAG: LysR family transcriptional regulator [Deltaproteobacteria bacterium]|nr:LysR family transcriptional regulator [Candidatus Anaeroferrophillacea bacterium]
MNLTQIRAMDALARTGSLTRAAKAIGISQPAISQQLRRLQDDCGGVILFRRTGRSVEFTEIGREAAIKAGRLLGLLDDLHDTLEAARDLRHGYLNIGLSCHHFVMGLVADYMCRYPDIQVRARIGDSINLLDDVRGCRLHVAGITAEEPVSGLFNQLFSRQRIVLFVGRDHPWAAETRLSAGKLDGRRMVTWHSTSMTRTIFTRRLGAKGIRSRVVLELDSWETIREAVAGGMGFGIALADECTADPRLRQIPLDGVDTEVRQYFVCLPEFIDLGTVKAFFELAAERQEERDPDDGRAAATTAATTDFSP